MKYNFKNSTIGDACLLVTDGSHFSPKSVEHGEYMVSVKDFTPYGFDFDNCRQISANDYEKLKKSGCIPQYEDILIGKDGARYFEDIVVYRQTEQPALLSSIAILRCNTNELLPDYLYYMMINPAFKQNVRDNYGSGSAIPRIILKDFKRMPISYPSIKVQQRIISILRGIDAKIELNSKINANLQQQAQAIFKSWFVDFEPFQNGEFVESELGPIPKGWKVLNFTDAIDILGGGTPKTNNESFWNGDIPFFTPKDINNQTYTISTEKNITEDGLKHCNSQLYPVNTVFVTARGTVGKVCLAGKAMAMNQSCYALIGKEDYGQLWVYHIAQQVVKHLIHKANGAVFSAIVTRDFSSEIIICPPKVVVEKFLEIVSPLYNMMLIYQNGNARLAEIRDTLLPKLMNGEIEATR